MNNRTPVAGWTRSCRFGMPRIVGLLLATAIAAAGCGGGGSSGGGGGGGTIRVEVPLDLVYGLTAAKTTVSCTGASSSCIADGVEQYRVDVSVTVDGNGTSSAAPVALVVTAPAGSRIHLDAAASSAHYQTAVIGVIPDGAATSFFVRATTNGNYTVQISHQSAPNITALVRTVPDLIFQPDPNVPTAVEVFEANDFLTTASGGQTIVKARLLNAEMQVITGAAAAQYSIGWTSTDPLGNFTPAGAGSPSPTQTIGLDGVAEATFSTNTFYPSGGTVTIRAQLQGDVIFDDAIVTVYEDLAAPIAAEFGIISGSTPDLVPGRFAPVSPNPIPSYLSSAANGGLDGFMGKDFTRADRFQVKVRILSAHEVASGEPCNSFTPGTDGEIVCLPAGTLINIDCENALDPGDSSVILAPSDCSFASTPTGSAGSSIALTCGVTDNIGDPGTADQCQGTFFLRVAKNSVKVRTGAGFTKVLPKLRIRTTGPVTATPPKTRRYGSQSGAAAAGAVWAGWTFTNNSVTGEENEIRLRPDPSLPFLLKWAEPLTTSAPLGGCSITDGNTAGNKIARCTADPSYYVDQCFLDAFPPTGVPAYDQFACTDEVSARCFSSSDVFRAPAGTCSAKSGDGINDVPRIPLRLQIAPSTCRTLADLTAQPDDCQLVTSDADLQPQNLSATFTYTGSQSQPPYVVALGMNNVRNSSEQAAGVDNISLTGVSAINWYPYSAGPTIGYGSTFLLPPLNTSTPSSQYKVTMSATPVSASTTSLPSDTQSIVVNPNCFAPAQVSCVRGQPTVPPASPNCLTGNPAGSVTRNTVQANNNATGFECAYYTCEVKTFGELYAGQTVDGQIMCPTPAAQYLLQDDLGYSLRFIDKGRAGSSPADLVPGDPDGREIDADGGAGESDGIEMQFVKGSDVADGAGPSFGSAADTSVKNVSENIVNGKASVWARFRSTSRAESQTATMIVRLQENQSGLTLDPLEPVTLLQTEVNTQIRANQALPGTVSILFRKPEVVNVAPFTDDTSAVYSRQAALDAAFAAAHSIGTSGGATDYRNSQHFSRVAVVTIKTLAGDNITTSGGEPTISYALTGSSGTAYTTGSANQSCSTTAVSGPVVSTFPFAGTYGTWNSRVCLVSDGNPNLAPTTPATTTLEATLANCPVDKQPKCKTTKALNVTSVRRTVSYQFPMTRTSGTSAINFAGFSLDVFFNDRTLAYDPADPLEPSAQDFLALNPNPGTGATFPLPYGPGLKVLQDSLLACPGALGCPVSPGDPGYPDYDHVKILQSTGSNAYQFPANAPNSREVVRMFFTIRNVCTASPCNDLPGRLAYDPTVSEIVSVPVGPSRSEISAYAGDGVTPVLVPLTFSEPTAVHAAKNFGQ